MTELRAKELLKAYNRKGDPRSKDNQAFLVKIVNEQLGILNGCVRVSITL